MVLARGLPISDKGGEAIAYPVRNFPHPGPVSAVLRRTGAWRGAMQKSRLFDIRDSMDNEQINAIGTALADLSERTEQLRGYL